MSKMSEFAAELAELRHCGEILIGISESLTELFSNGDLEAEKETDRTVTGIGGETPPATAKELTLVDVRKVMTEKSRSGYTKEVRALLEKYGTSNLSGLNPAHYASILAEVEELGNA